MSETTLDQDAYWLRAMATAAMQGILSNPNINDLHTDEVGYDAMCYATALLKAVKESEAKNA